MTEHNDRTTNRLIHEKSPYLLQHAYNPVDWFPWSDEAFTRAKNEDKPVFLSIGYSTCHWCHVMEKESFEDEEVASLMNDTFVSIKVDREERPDIDNIYMTVCQMLTGSGGWPLTIVMTPDKKPFFAATYIPKHDRFGRTGMIELVPRLKEIWQARRKDVLHSADQITDALQQSVSVSSGPPVGEAALHNGYRQIAQRFDRVFGGFGDSPKFPTPHQFSFLLRYWRRTRDPHALEMVEKSLQHMRRGGIYDHVGFGFHRYSTDREWLVPHFEKMLYDQALLVIAYLEAFQVTGNPEYAETAREILTYVVSDMTSPEGAFYSAEDADSEGVEGKFYVWTPEEFREILGEEDAAFFMKIWNVEENGNFYDQATGQRSIENILHLRKPVQELAALYEIPEIELRKRIEIAREKLYRYREQRIHPHKDDKVLTDWNGLMIAAMARASRILDEPAYATAARRAAGFLLTRMKNNDGSLLHRYRSDEAGLTATLDDYAFLIWGLIEMYEATFEVWYLKTAIELNEYQLEHFWDENAGGFFFTSVAGEQLLVRNKEIYDGAIPSGNSVSMLNLLRLSRMTGRSEWEDKAAAIERAFSQQITQIPSAHTQLLIAVDFAVGPSFEVVIAGQPDEEQTQVMLKFLRRSFVPNKVVLLRPPDDRPEIAGIAPYTQHQKSIDGKATAYVCRNFVCSKPTTSAEEMLQLITSEEQS